MVFGSPLAFALAALAIPVVVFYILKVRLRRVPVSTNLFWKQIYDEKPPRSLWQYLRHLLSLLVQLLVVTLLVLAVANPYLPWQLLQARRIVAVIDNSASMRATDVSPSRFEAAVNAALATVEGLRFRDELAIVLAGPEPEVVVGMSGHVPTLRRALRSIQISDNPTRLQPAVDLGTQLIAGHPQGQVLVFTDGCTADDVPIDGARTSESQTESNTAAPATELRIFGTSDAGNVGITRFQVRRSLIDPLGYEVLVSVKNASSHRVQGRLELELADSPVDILPLEFEPNGLFSRSLEKTSLEGGTLIATLTELALAEDDKEPTAETKGNSREEPAPEINALGTDDRAWAVLPPRTIQNVLIVTPGNLFLQKVFEANPLVRVTVQKGFPETWPSGGIIVLHRELPDTLPAGNLLVVDPIGDCDAWELGDQIADPIVTEQDEKSALMTHVRLDNVIMPKARQLHFADRPHILAGTLSGDPVYAEVKRDSGKCLVLSVDINEGDLAFRTAFPIVVANSLGWFGGRTGELRESLPTGSITEIDLADAGLTVDETVALRSPSAETQSLALRMRKDGQPEGNGEAVVDGASGEIYVGTPPLAQCGVWKITPEGDDGSDSPLAELAVNLSDPSESDLRCSPELIDSEPTTLAAGWLTRPIWYYLVAIACLITILEWRWHQRRILT